jgi:hypothetical protein
MASEPPTPSNGAENAPQMNDLFDLYTFAVKETGRTDLWTQGGKILDEKEALLKTLAEPSGRVLAERELEKREKALELRLAAKRELWTVAVEAIEAKRKLEMKLNALKRIQDLEKEEAKPFRDIHKGLHALQSRFEEVSYAQIIKGDRALVNALKSPLRRYHRLKIIRRTATNVAYLLLTFVVIELGGDLIKEFFPNLTSRFIAIVGIWFLGLQASRIAERRLERLQQESFEKSVGRFFWVLLWATAIEAELDHRATKVGPDSEANPSAR